MRLVPFYPHRRRTSPAIGTASILLGGVFLALVCASRAELVRIEKEVGAPPIPAGARWSEDYGSFLVYEVPDGSDANISGAQTIPSASTIRLKTRSIDTAISQSPPAPAGSSADAGPSKFALKIVQFRWPIKPEWRSSLEAAGAVVVHY
ncbi:hypothetical protein HY256_05155, partial [Candidatus Sumerlaeota bacterium]|nr:hypothetical protein [Candidatus Sumerlaeota bacterium]